MNPNQLPSSHRLDKIEESAAQIENAINKVEDVKIDLIAVAFVPGTDEGSIIDGLDAGLELLSSPAVELLAEQYTRLIKLDASQTEPVLEALLKEEKVQWAGPVVALHERSFAYLTHELIVQIDDPADTGRVLDRTSELGYERLRRIPYVTPVTYHLRAKHDRHPGRRLFAHARELMAIEGVVAEPNLAGTAEPDVAPGRKLSPELWDRKKIQTEAAWELLETNGKPGHDDPDVVLAVVDGSLDKTHPGLRKYQRKDFRHLTGDGTVHHLFEGGAKGHGMRVAGVAAAAGEDNGVLGVAPECSVLGLFYPATELDVLDMYLWAAGIDPESPRKGFPELPRRSAHVVVTSVRFGFSRKIPMSRPAAATFDLIASKGRGDKGCLLFFSAGNSSADTSVDNPWATHEKNFGIAASTLGAGKREVRAAYSNYRGVELCAPSSENLRGHPSGLKRGTLSLAITGLGNRSGTRTKAAQSGGNYTDAFGGTSSAAPLAAGVAALVLTARPELTRDEVCGILRDSAVEIDSAAKGQETVWRDDQGREAKRSRERVQSWAYGFGRVDAKGAVQAALGFNRSKSTARTVTKTGSAKASPLGAGLDWASVSLILGLYHLVLFAILLWAWPCGDSDCLAWASLVLGAYHLIVFAVLKPLRRWFKDTPDDEDPAADQGDPRG